MNDTTLLRDFGPDAPPADPAMIAAARAALMTHIADSGTSQVHRLRHGRGFPVLRRGRRLTVSAAVAAITVAGLTAALVTVGGHAGVNADAHAVLIKAANGTAALPSARQGQYYFQSTQLASAGGVDCPGAPDGDIELTTVRQIDEWIPADRTGNARTVERQARKPAYTSRSDARHAATGCPDVLRHHPGTSSSTVTVAPVGKPEGHSGTGPFQRYDQRSLARWPRDPAALYQRFTDAAHGNDVEAFVNATDLLGGGLLLTPDLRTAVLHAMSMIPGISVQHRATAGFGRRGTALTVRNNQGSFRIVLDPQNGLVLAQESFLPDGTSIDNLTDRYGISPSNRKPPAHSY